MAENFQDNVAYSVSTLAVSGDAIAIGSTNANAKSVIFNNSGSQGVLAWQPSANMTINLPNTGGTLQLSGQAPGGIAAGTQSATSGTVIFSNSNGLSFGMSNSSVVTASYTVPSTAGLISAVNISAGTTSSNISNFVFSNSNNVSFGLNGSTITASINPGGQSVQTQNVIVAQAGTQTATSGTVVFSNSNGISFGMSNSSVITASYTVPTQTVQSINVSAGTTSNNLTNFVLSNSNGLSFGLNGSTITGSYTVPTQSVQTQNVAVPSAGTQTATSGTVIFSNSNGISFGMSNSSVITASYTVPTQTVQSINLSAGTTSNNLTNFVLSNSNGISFGLNASTITASYTVPTQSAQTQNVIVAQAGTQTATSGTVIFSNSNGISFGMSNSSVITASYTVPTQTVQSINVSAGTTSNNLTNFVLSNSNGLSFGLNGSTITGSYTQAAQTNQTEGFYALGNTVGQSSSSTFDARTLSISGIGNISVGYSANALIISGSAAAGSVNISAGTTSNNLTNFVFSNSNNVSFGLNGSTITATITTPAQTAQTVGLYALGNTTQNSSTTLDARTLSFNGLGIITAGYSNGSIQISATQSAQTQNVVVAQAGTQTATSGTVVFSNSNGISFGMSNSSVVTASYTVPSTAGLISQINVSAGTTSNNLTALTFSNSNGISFGLNASTITASYTVPTQTAQTVGLYALGNTTQNSSTTLDARSLSFNGLGIITAGYSNGSIQISATQSNQTANIVVPSAGTQTATSGTVVFSNSNGISFGMSNSSVVTASYTVPSTAGLISQINVSAGTTSNNLSALTFSNSNGISFGLNASTITASYTVPTQTAQTIGLYAVSNTTGASSSTTVDARSLSFQGAGIASVGYTNGSVVVSVPSGAANINISAGTTSNNLTNFVFSNSNNVSFGLNGSTVTATVTTPAQTAQTIGLYAIGNTTQNSSTTLDARTLSFNGLGIITAGYSNGSIQISATQSNQTANIVVPSAGTQTATSGTVSFVNSNGISFGMSNSNAITASYTVPTQTVQTIGLYALGNTTQNSSTTLDARTLSFDGLGIITVGYSNGSIQISATQSNQTQSNVQGISAGTQLGQTGNIVFSNSNGITFGMSNSSIITASYTVPTQTVQSINVSAGTTSNNLTNFVLSNSNGVSFGLNGSTITASAAGGGSLNISAGTTSNNLTNLVLSNSNNVSFGLNGSTITGSIPNQTYSFVNSNNITFGINASTITASAPQNISAGTTSNNFTNIVFSNSNGISFGLSGSTITGAQSTLVYSNSNNITFGINASTITASAPHNISAGTTSNNFTNIVFSNSNGISFGLSGSTITGAQSTLAFSNSNNVSFGIVGSTLTASASFNQTVQSINFSAGTTNNFGINQYFINSNNVSFGMSGSTLTASIPQQTLSRLGNVTANFTTGYLGSTTTTGGFVQFFPIEILNNFSFSRFDLFLSVSLSTSSNSSMAGTLSFGIGIFTRNASTLSVLSSGSQSYAFTNTSNNSTSVLSGFKNISIPINVNMSPNDYYIGIFSRTTSAGNNWMTISNVIVPTNPANTFSGFWGSASNTSNQLAVGFGQVTLASTTLNASYAISALIGSNSSFQLVPAYNFVNVTV